MEVTKTIVLLFSVAIFCIIGFFIKESIQYLCLLYLGVSAIVLITDMHWDTDIDLSFYVITIIFTICIASAVGEKNTIFTNEAVSKVTMCLAIIVIIFSISPLMYSYNRSD